MDVDVLPLEGILKRVNGFHETVRDFDSFFAALKKCPGDDDKPLRVLQTKFGGRLMAKFACAGTQRTQSLQDERRNLSKLKGPHIEDMVWNGEHNDNIAILTEYIEPFGRFHTMRDLVHASDVEWRSTFFQVLFTLATLQSNFPGFRHNDLKADNVLITYGKAKSYSFQHLGMRRTFFLPAGPCVKIIDFELASTPDKTFQNDLMNEADPSLSRDFGIQYEPCDVYDIHLLSVDCLRNRNKVMNAFFTFVTHFMPANLFDFLRLTVQLRLKIEDQKSLHLSLYPGVLFRMMCHPYFFHFRGDERVETDYTII